MPCHAAQRVWEKCQLSERKSPYRDVSQVSLIAVNRLQDAARREPYGRRKPSQIIACRNNTFTSQFRNKAPFEGWERQQRSVDIEKSRHARSAGFAYAIRIRAVDVRHGLHAVFLTETFATAIFAVATGARLPAMNCQPSTKTGIARTKQNTAVAEVSATAPLRMAACAEGVSPPNNATGPRVNANSSPR